MNGCNTVSNYIISWTSVSITTWDLLYTNLIFLLFVCFTQILLHFNILKWLQFFSYTYDSCCSQAIKETIFTHIVSFERVWRTTVVSQELCNLLSQAARQRDKKVFKRIHVYFVQFLIWATWQMCSLIKNEDKCQLLSLTTCVPSSLNTATKTGQHGACQAGSAANGRDMNSFVN